MILRSLQNNLNTSAKISNQRLIHACQWRRGAEEDWSHTWPQPAAHGDHVHTSSKRQHFSSSSVVWPPETQPLPTESLWTHTHTHTWAECRIKHSFYVEVMMKRGCSSQNANRSHLNWGTPAGLWPSECWRCSSAQPGTLTWPTPTCFTQPTEIFTCVSFTLFTNISETPCYCSCYVIAYKHTRKDGHITQIRAACVTIALGSVDSSGGPSPGLLWLWSTAPLSLQDGTSATTGPRSGGTSSTAETSTLTDRLFQTSCESQISVCSASPLGCRPPWPYLCSRIVLQSGPSSSRAWGSPRNASGPRCTALEQPLCSPTPTPTSQTS